MSTQEPLLSFSKEELTTVKESLAGEKDRIIDFRRKLRSMKTLIRLDALGIVTTGIRDSDGEEKDATAQTLVDEEMKLIQSSIKIDRLLAKISTGGTSL